MLTGASADAAGPVTTEPLAMLNLLPWHGQLTVPPDTLETVQPWWVHTAVNASNEPARGHPAVAGAAAGTSGQRCGACGAGAGQQGTATGDWDPWLGHDGTPQRLMPKAESWNRCGPARKPVHFIARVRREGVNPARLGASVIHR